MANEYRGTLIFKNTSSTGNRGVTYSNIGFDSSDADLGQERILSVSTSEVAIPLGNVSTPGVLVVYHAGTTNNISILHASAGNTLSILEPGQFSVLSLKGFSTAPYAIAAAGTETLEYMITEGS